MDTFGSPTASRGEDIMISIDFAGLHEPQCKGVESAGSEKSDFELWSPHDDGRHGTSNKCFLGQQVMFSRMIRANIHWPENREPKHNL